MESLSTCHEERVSRWADCDPDPEAEAVELVEVAVAVVLEEDEAVQAAAEMVEDSFELKLDSVVLNIPEMFDERSDSAEPLEVVCTAEADVSVLEEHKALQATTENREENLEVAADSVGLGAAIWEADKLQAPAEIGQEKLEELSDSVVVATAVAVDSAVLEEGKAGLDHAAYLDVLIADKVKERADALEVLASRHRRLALAKANVVLAKEAVQSLRCFLPHCPHLGLGGCKMLHSRLLLVARRPRSEGKPNEMSDRHSELCKGCTAFLLLAVLYPLHGKGLLDLVCDLRLGLGHFGPGSGGCRPICVLFPPLSLN